MRQTVVYFILLIGLTAYSPSWADVWKVVAEDGTIHYTNEAPGKNAQLIIDSNSGYAPQAKLDVTGMTGGNPLATVAMINALPAYRSAHPSLVSAAESYGVDYDLIKAVAATESAFNPLAVSKKGAVGLMQLMPETAKRYGVMAEPGATVASKLKNPDLNIHTGTHYLADLMRLYAGDKELALAAYNAGEGAVARAGNRIPNFKETQSYVRRVLGVYRALQTRTG
jgi:soluble lytic murein transglycosylase-like protein